MQRIYRSLTPTIILCLTLLLFSGCTSYLSNVGKTALDIETLNLDTKQPETRVWQTQDFLIKYDVVPAGNSVTIDGTLFLQDRISYSFPTPQYFYFYINYVDSNNVVLSSHDITPLLAFRTFFQDSFPLRSVPPAPPGTEAFVFSYWGNFTGNGSDNDNDERGGTGDWEVYYSPFEKKS